MQCCRFEINATGIFSDYHESDQFIGRPRQYLEPGYLFRIDLAQIMLVPRTHVNDDLKVICVARELMPTGEWMVEVLSDIEQFGLCAFRRVAYVDPETIYSTMCGITSIMLTAINGTEERCEMRRNATVGQVRPLAGTMLGVSPEFVDLTYEEGMVQDNQYLEQLIEQQHRARKVTAQVRLGVLVNRTKVETALNSPDTMTCIAAIWALDRTLQGGCDITGRLLPLIMDANYAISNEAMSAVIRFHMSHGKQQTRVNLCGYRRIQGRPKCQTGMWFMIRNLTGKINMLPAIDPRIAMAAAWPMRCVPRTVPVHMKIGPILHVYDDRRKMTILIPSPEPQPRRPAVWITLWRQDRALPRHLGIGLASIQTVEAGHSSR